MEFTMEILAGSGVFEYGSDIRNNVYFNTDRHSFRLKIKKIESSNRNRFDKWKKFG